MVFKRKSGFSLIELMVVMVIVGLLMSIVTVNLDYLVPSSRLNAGASSIASTIVLAHSQAAISGTDVIVSYNLDQQLYQIILVKEGKTDPLSISELPPGIKFKDIIVAGESKKTNGIFQVYISPLGIVRGHVVHLENRDRQVMSIEVNPISGTVEVLEDYKEMDFIEKS